MKKIVAITALLLFVVSNSCFAAALASGAVTAGDALTIYGGSSAAVASSNTAVIIGKTSKGVRMGAAYNTAGYSINTKHDSGTKAFGTAHDATALYTTEVGTGALTAGPSAIGYTAFQNWTAM